MQSTRPISKNCEDPTSPFVLVFDQETGKLDYLRGAELTEFSSLFEQRYGQLRKSDDALAEDEDTKEADKADTRSGHPTQCYCLQCNPWTDEEWELAMLTHPSVDLTIALRNARSHLDRRRLYLEWVRNGKPCVAEINVLEYSESTPTTSQKESSQEAGASGSRAEKELELTKAEPIVMFIQDAFAQRISYDDIFGRCCDENVTKVVVEDPYIVGTHATGTRNFEAFCRILSNKCANLKTIELKTRPELEDVVNPLAVKILARHKIDVVFTAYDQHPRIFYFDNGWTVLADKGLDIWSRKRSPAGQSASSLTYFTFFGPGVELPACLRLRPVALAAHPSECASVDPNKPSVSGVDPQTQVAEPLGVPTCSS